MPRGYFNHSREHSEAARKAHKTILKITPRRNNFLHNKIKQWQVEWYGPLDDETQMPNVWDVTPLEYIQTKADALDRFYFEIKDEYGLSKKDIKINAVIEK